MRAWPLRCVSGMISSLMTNSIAPAANASPIGRTGRAKATAPAPNRPPIGSTRPVAVAIHNAYQRLYPSRIRGRATARPSGMFWSPMPMARLIPLFIDSSVPPPNPTPTASPSGKLWSVMAKMKSQTRRRLLDGPSRPLMKCSCGSQRSARSRKNPPARIPPTTASTASTGFP